MYIYIYIYMYVYIEYYILDYKIIGKGMAATPVKILGLKYPLCKCLIDNISKKMAAEN